MPVQVTGGLIEGITSPVDPAVKLYKGVPYAAPPTGPNRFRPPQPVVPWDDVKTCDTTGPVCPQAAPDPRYVDIIKGHPQSEDCLYLNVFVPSDAHEKPYPVYVWYHGGGFREGGAADPNFDGTGLAQKGVIVVVPSFRLHVYGYFAHPELSAQSPSGTSGMVGMLDAVQVLEWVRDNIAAFGGNPNQVTVGGQSAGNAMCHTLLTAPPAKGLLHGVILQSGPRSFQEPALGNGPMSYRPLKQAEEDGVALLKELGLKDVAAFQALDDVELFRKLSLRRDNRCWGPPPFFRLVLDGHVIPKPYHEIFSDPNGPANDVPVLGGMNSDEGGTYNEPRLTYDDFLACVEGRLGTESTYGKGGPEWVKRYMKLYPPADHDTGKGPLEAWNRAARDNTRNNISLWAQEYHQNTKSPVYGYYFTHAIPHWHGWTPDLDAVPKTPGFTNQKGPIGGSYHGAELPYCFNSLVTTDIRPWNEEDRLVGDRVSSLWANFIKYGNPNGPANGMNERPDGVGFWPTLHDEPHQLMELGKVWDVIPTVDQERESFWNEYIHGQRAW